MVGKAKNITSPLDQFLTAASNITAVTLAKKLKMKNISIFHAPARKLRQLNQVLVRKHREYTRGFMDCANWVNDQSDIRRNGVYLVGDLALLKFNLIGKRQVRRRPRFSWGVAEIGIPQREALVTELLDIFMEDFNAMTPDKQAFALRQLFANHLRINQHRTYELQKIVEHHRRRKAKKKEQA